MRLSDFEFYLSDVTIARNRLRIVRLRECGTHRHKDFRIPVAFDVKYIDQTLSFICSSWKSQ